MKSSPPLIAHVVNSLRMGGLENGLVNLINRLPDDSYRHCIICLTDYDDFSKRIKKDHVPIFALHKKAGKDPGWYRRMWKMLRVLKPDILHTRNLATIESQLIAFLSGVPGRVHGEHGWDMYDLHGSNRKYRLLRRLVSPVIGHFIPLSRELEDYLICNINISKSKITRICNGVDSQRFKPGSRSELLPFKINNENLMVIGWIGRMESVKDPLNLIQAFITIVQSRPELRERLRLVMVGNGARYEDARAMLKAAGVDDIAWLPGHRDDIPELLQQFDIFVLSSKAEGISNTILEAMATGLPIVATQVGGNSELVEEGKNGTLVAASDSMALALAIIRYVENDELRKQHGASSRKRVEARFSIEYMVSEYMKVYDNVLAN